MYCIYVRIYVRVYIYIHTYIYTFIYIHIYIHNPIYNYYIYIWTIDKHIFMFQTGSIVISAARVPRYYTVGGCHVLQIWQHPQLGPQKYIKSALGFYTSGYLINIIHINHVSLYLKKKYHNIINDQNIIYEYHVILYHYLYKYRK